MPLQWPQLGDFFSSPRVSRVHAAWRGQWVPGHSMDLLAGPPTDTHATALLQAAGPGSAVPQLGAPGELQRPPACCGKQLLPSSALHIPPLLPSPRRQLRALLRRLSGKRGKRVTQAASNVLSAAKPGLPLLRLLHPSDAPAPACSTAACKPARRRPPRLTGALGKHHAVSAWPPAPLQRSRAGCKHPVGFSKCKGPHTPARKRGHVLPHNVVVLMCFGSALQPVPPTALAPGLPGTALGSPPSGCLGPCVPSLPSLVARVKCVLRPV